MNYDPEDKYQAMVRAYDKLKALATDIGSTVVIGDHAAGDAATAFFNACYHLKDWLKKDSRIHDPRDVERFVSSSTALSLAADLCNSQKHAGLDNTPRSGRQLDQINMAYSLDLPTTPVPGSIEASRNPSDEDTIRISVSNRQGRPVATAKVVLTIGGQIHDALDVATECVKDWDIFLAGRGIQLSKS